MKKIEAIWKDGKLIFGHFIVKKESDHFVGVYQRCGSNCGSLVTSDTTVNGAAKKAKLLEIGWRLGEENADAYHKEECRFCSK
jgi:hypothetical protein